MVPMWFSTRLRCYVGRENQTRGLAFGPRHWLHLLVRSWLRMPGIHDAVKRCWAAIKAGKAPSPFAKKASKKTASRISSKQTSCQQLALCTTVVISRPPLQSFDEFQAGCCDQTTLAVFKKAGSNSMPIPGPDGTGIMPSLISKFGVYHDSFLAGPRETYSIHGPILGVVAAN